MIAIVNIGPKTDDPMGERNYEVRINEEVICYFKHNRSDGLESCMYRAAEAVRKENERRKNLQFAVCK